MYPKEQSYRSPTSQKINNSIEQHKNCSSFAIRCSPLDPPRSTPAPTKHKAYQKSERTNTPVVTFTPWASLRPKAKRRKFSRRMCIARIPSPRVKDRPVTTWKSSPSAILPGRVCPDNKRNLEHREPDRERAHPVIRACRSMRIPWPLPLKERNNSGPTPWYPGVKDRPVTRKNSQSAIPPKVDENPRVALDRACPDDDERKVRDREPDHPVANAYRAMRIPWPLKERNNSDPT